MSLYYFYYYIHLPLHDVMQPWATIYNNGSTFATGRTSSNIWIDMSCGADQNSYPTATTVNTCLTNSRPLASMNIALNTGSPHHTVTS